uniref:Uncharacterized protein n=1 Tax=Chenopodium quinoa TaxID=63459 RepID=A0A803N8G8_CHEQI
MPELQLIELEDGSEEFPRSRFWMSLEQKRKFCQVIKNSKLPQGYASNLSRCVQVGERKIAGYKSQDALFMMNYLLPIVVKTTLPKDVASPLIRLSPFFKGICSNSNDPYSEVIPEPKRKSRVRLQGKGVKKSNLKKKENKSDFIFLAEFLENMQAQLVQQLAPSVTNAILTQLRDANIFLLTKMGNLLNLEPQSIRILFGSEQNIKYKDLKGHVCPVQIRL